MNPYKLAIAVTFHYVEERLRYLNKVASQFHLLADETTIHIFTNAEGYVKKHRILKAVDPENKLNVQLHTPTYLGHPYLLTWSHFYVFRKLFESDKLITHFMYLEDDILITPKNIQYWLSAREDLKSENFYPSFLRYELNNNSLEPYSSDLLGKLFFNNLPKIKKSNRYCYLSLPYPYQGMYFFDRELMREHLQGPSSIPQHHRWGIREQAAAGLTFSNVRDNFFSRNLIGYDVGAKKIDIGCLIHHLPNNYVDQANVLLGKIKVNELIVHGELSYMVNRIKNKYKSIAIKRL